MNNAEINILLLSDADGGTYELYTIAQDALGQDIQPQRGLGNAACFVSRNRFAVLSQGSRLVLKNFANEPKRTVDLPISNVVNLFPAGVGRVLLVCSDKVLLFDIEARKVLGEVSVQARCPVKTIVWSRDRKYCAIVSKFVIYICGGADLADIATLTENARIKVRSRLLYNLERLVLIAGHRVVLGTPMVYSFTRRRTTSSTASLLVTPVSFGLLMCPCTLPAFVGPVAPQWTAWIVMARRAALLWTTLKQFSNLPSWRGGMMTFVVSSSPTNWLVNR